ncbi:hypothetical protein LOK49_LG06G02932 [Camellia lanceoleosa]|uniref:Uncharacterized protein n=1 Tax=Camellia lanceoleosa TaxID=1840588 RepID=A0ACC0HJ77_9ERIC|nr:hypothetical protein LOK49_LG06G02932 [Camellia lanceoleosa]
MSHGHRRRWRATVEEEDGGDKYPLHKPTNRPRYCSKSNTYYPLPPIQPLCTCKFLQEFQHHHLKNNGNPNDRQKQLALMYSLEDIPLLEFPSVEFVENLAKHESIEYQRVVDIRIHSKD